MSFAPKISMAQKSKELVRLAVIEVDTNQLNHYNEFLREEIESSIRLEPGVITLYAVAEKEYPERITIFETYADSSQYKAHLTTPHFEKYKKGTLKMVKQLELIDMTPILYIRKPTLASVNTQDLYIRVVQLEINPNSISKFKDLAQSVILPGVKEESGVVAMYAVSEKNDPSKITILEVYSKQAAYQDHLKTLHFLKYKRESEKIVKSLKIIEVKPILLGSKLQE